MKNNRLLTGMFCVPRQIIACYYMTFLRLRREKELVKINLISNEAS